MSVRRRLVGAAGGMAAITVASRVSGYLRDKVVAALLGAGGVADAFYAGLAVPNMFRAFLAEGALHAAFIPSLSELVAGKDTQGGRRFVRAMTTTLMVILPLVVAGGVVAAPWLVKLVAKGLVSRDREIFELAVLLTRLMFPYLALISLAALAQGVLNASGRFLLPAATPIALNLSIVAGTAVAATVMGGRWEWLALGVVCGGALQLALQLPGCARVGLPLLPGAGGPRHPEVRRVLARMAPGIPALGIYQVTLLLSYRFASTVGDGALTCKFNAARLNELIYGVLIVQLTTALLPMLSAERSEDPERGRSVVAFAARLISVVTLPGAVFAGLMAGPIVGTAFGGGRYTPEDVAVTAGALAMYAVGLPFLGMTKLFAGSSYAWKDTRRPVIAAAVNLVVFYALATWWTPLWGVAGIAAASSAGQAGNAATLLTLGRRTGWVPAAGAVMPYVLRHVLASLVMGAGLLAMRPLLPPMEVTSLAALATLGGVAAVAGATYVGLLMVLRAGELAELRAFLRARRERRRQGRDQERSE